MVELKSSPPYEVEVPELDVNISRVDEDLKIMETHAAELAAMEDGIQDSMKRRDREYKDAHFHAVPKGRKHQP